MNCPDGMGLQRTAPRMIGAAMAATAVFTVTGCETADAATDPLAGTTWQLLSIESMAPDEELSVAIDDPAKYTVAFSDDGRGAFRVDCNRGSGTWQATAAAPDSGALSFGPIALSRMHCPQPSQENKVTAALSEVRSYLITDGRLHLSLAVDGGIMHWEPAG